MKTTSLIDLASRRGMTLGRAAAEVLRSAGQMVHCYPVVVRRQPIPVRLLRQARWYHQRPTRWSGYSPMNGPRRPLP